MGFQMYGLDKFNAAMEKEYERRKQEVQVTGREQWCTSMRAYLEKIGARELFGKERIGAEAYLTEAEAGVGLQAWLEVDKRREFFVNLSACPVDGKMGWICFGLHLKRKI
jgi:hypothetical protein